MPQLDSLTDSVWQLALTNWGVAAVALAVAHLLLVRSPLSVRRLTVGVVLIVTLGIARGAGRLLLPAGAPTRAYTDTLHPLSLRDLPALAHMRCGGQACACKRRCT